MQRGPNLQRGLLLAPSPLPPPEAHLSERQQQQRQNDHAPLGYCGNLANTVVEATVIVDVVAVVTLLPAVHDTVAADRTIGPAGVPDDAGL